ncbi:phytanoyl-CoA dioxygenase family protein [Cadophora sp. DSE1049]|nr:phytanoyl-CoA dioxygenase family protein [Cadophora sp. DSE1049]
MVKLSSLPKVVQVSPEERSAGALTWKNLEIANRALHHDGLVVLENAIPTAQLDRLNEKMVQDALTLQSAGDDMPYNYNKGNIQQDPPLATSHFSPSIFLNPLATQVTSSVLGPLPRLSFISGNSDLPQTSTSPPKSQPTHSDADFSHPSSPFALVINIPLVDMTPSNGSTEIWLGTHVFGKEVQEGEHGEWASGRIKGEELERRRKVREPSQPVIKKGSLVVRDLRLWHGGMPNRSGEVRVMLAMIHFAPWFRNAMQVDLSEELRGEIEKYGRGLKVQARYLPEREIEEKYLKGAYGNAYDFDQKDKLAGVF